MRHRGELLKRERDLSTLAWRGNADKAALETQIKTPAAAGALRLRDCGRRAKNLKFMMHQVASEKLFFVGQFEIDAAA